MRVWFGTMWKAESQNRMTPSRCVEVAQRDCAVDIGYFSSREVDVDRVVSCRRKLELFWDRIGSRASTSSHHFTWL